MSQTKVELNSLIWVELTFKGYKDAMIFCVSIFIFCLEPTEREELDENDFRHYYGIFFRKYHSKTTWSQLYSKLFRNNYKAFETMHYCWRFYEYGSPYELSFSRVNILDIFEGAWKSIIYTVIRACSSYNIAPRHFTHFCMLLFLSNKRSL